MSGFESFSKKEKNVFSSLFARESDSESDSDSESYAESSGGSEVNNESSLENPSETEALAQNGDGDGLATERLFKTSVELDLTFEEPREIEIVLIERRHLGIAHQLWPAAEFLCNFFKQKENLKMVLPNIDDPSSIKPVPVLELGAGIGLCGMYVAELVNRYCSIVQSQQKAKVVLTDLPEALEGLMLNITRNSLQESVVAQMLRWGVAEDLDEVMSQFDGAIPLVLAADCVYWECLYTPLFQTLQGLLARGCMVIISHVRRWKKDGKFFAMCRKAGFSVTVLVEEVKSVPAEHTGLPTRQVTRVYCIKQ
jgi:protein N-lysine methyltransferase METTL21C